jgi:Golgi phosphoprotein 3 (GPP34)
MSHPAQTNPRPQPSDSWQLGRPQRHRPLGRDLRRTLYERLAAAGAVRAERARVLGVFPVRRWPAQDASHAAEVRRLVTQALVQQAAPDPGSAVLIALVHALKCEHKIVDPRPSGLSRRQLRARAEQIAQSSWTSQALRQMIDATTAAVRAAAAASASAG